MSKGQTLVVRRWFFVMTVVLVGAGESLFASSHSVGMAFAAISLWGMAAGLFNPASRIAFLKAAPAEMHGRAMGLWRAVQSFGSLAPRFLPVSSHMPTGCGRPCSAWVSALCWPQRWCSGSPLGVGHAEGGRQHGRRRVTPARTRRTSGAPTSFRAADNRIHIEPYRRRRCCPLWKPRIPERSGECSARPNHTDC